ncbi:MULTISPECIES: ECF transporter S component [Aedoeadaptatus]|uniref:ECF transporter S component n=1 Tax=Aedoeadaptatus TaxID=2981628 RepID=UPI000D5558EB|nr:MULTISPECIES: ECF transporter S component [Peptoniphilaceae]MCU6786196.1 ECF transporter S component [Aedoeadaptatus acetigenes]
MKEYSVRELVFTALFIALVYVFTWLVKIQLPFAPNGGLIHLGNVPFFIACIFFSKRVGMLSGALGMGLFDLTSGWVAWSPMTVISALIMGYIMATLNTRDFRLSRYVLAAVLVTVVKVLTYYIGEAIMFKSLLVPLANIPGNVLQITVSAIIVGVLIPPMSRILKDVKL